MKRYMDKGTFLTALITFVLFVAAIFTKGITHDLFLEAGVFLVSVKIILLAYGNGVAIRSLDEKLDTIKAMLEKNNTHE